MTSDDQSFTATVRERRLPLLGEESLDDRQTASSQETSETGLVFVRRTESEGAAPPKPSQQGRVTLSSPPNPRLEELWQKAEGVMAAQKSRVREVMEEFGVGEVAPVSQQLEQELWQVVQGELTLQEAADLV